MDYVVKRGTGKLTVVLVSSAYQIKRSNLPYGIRLTATASDPDGRPLAGAAVTFTLSIPGIPTVTPGRHDGGQRHRDVPDDDPEGRRPRPGQRHGPDVQPTVSARRRTSRSSRSGSRRSPSSSLHDRGVRAVRQRPHAQLPSRHGDVALSTLRHPPGGDGPLLGLSPFQHLVRDLSPLPSLGRGQGGLLRPRSPAPADQRRRDPGLLGIAARDRRTRLPAAGVPSFVRTPVPRRDFIEVVEAVPVAADRRTAASPSRRARSRSSRRRSSTPRWSLWEDAEA